MVALDEIEEIYQSEIEKELSRGTPLSAPMLLDLSQRLYSSVKVKGIEDDETGDMLLFQYGVYNWGDEFGEHYSLDIARQFIMDGEDEPYQLSFTLIYDPEPFRQCRSYDCWSMDFDNADDFFNHIKSQKGFIMAGDVMPKTYKLLFEQC